VAFFPWSVDAIRLLNRAGMTVILATNQSGVARGYFPESRVAEVHAHIAEKLGAGGGRIDAYYYCPHHPEGTVDGYTRACDCRKPGAGMIERAVRELGVDPSRSFVVGDRWLDVGMARTGGTRGLLVRTGAGAEEEGTPPLDLKADAVVDNLMAAVSWVLLHRL
jgi:D-glycero-D-manno-heptose 1,7-bisphosphate phosphatase